MPKHLFAPVASLALARKRCKRSSVLRPARPTAAATSGTPNRRAAQCAVAAITTIHGTPNYGRDADTGRWPCSTVRGAPTSSSLALSAEWPSDDGTVAGSNCRRASVLRLSARELEEVQLRGVSRAREGLFEGGERAIGAKRHRDRVLRLWWPAVSALPIPATADGAARAPTAIRNAIEDLARYRGRVVPHDASRNLDWQLGAGEHEQAVGRHTTVGGARAQPELIDRSTSGDWGRKHGSTRRYAARAPCDGFPTSDDVEADVRRSSGDHHRPPRSRGSEVLPRQCDREAPRASGRWDQRDVIAGRHEEAAVSRNVEVERVEEGSLWAHPVGVQRVLLFPSCRGPRPGQRRQSPATIYAPDGELVGERERALAQRHHMVDRAQRAPLA